MSAANLVDTSPATERLCGGYRLGALLGRGASGETYAATAESGEACVVKLFAAAPGDDASATGEFRRLAAVAHPSVVRVRDVGRAADRRLYLVTDLVPGPALDSIAILVDDSERTKAFTRAARELADALGHLHGRGIVHGDVSPANVRLDASGRAVLIDFGLAGAARAAGSGGARGTLGYAAPEALTGARTPSGDLFALGASLFEAWSGTPPFGRGLPAAQRMLTGRAPALSAVRGGLGEAWDLIIARLLAPDARARTSSARELMRELTRATAGAATPTEIDLGVPFPEGDPLEGLSVGRESERGALRSAIERLAESRGAAGGAPAARALIAVVGAPGSGRRTLIDDVAREVAVAIAAGVLPGVEVWRGDLEALESRLGVAAVRGAETDETRVAERRFADIAEALERRAADRPLCVLLAEGPATHAFASFWAGAPPSGHVLIVVPAREAVGRPFAEDLRLGPLTLGDVAELAARATGEAVSETAVARIVAGSGGHAAVAAALVRRLVSAARAGRPGELRIEPGADLDVLLADSLASLPLAARRLVVGLALAGEPARAAGATAADEDPHAAARAAARAAGWLTGEAPDGLRLPSDAHRLAALAALGTPELSDIARAAAGALPADDPRRADALGALGRRAEAAEVLRRAGAAASQAGRPADAALLLERAAGLQPGALSLDEELELAAGLGVLGRYADAARAADRAAALAGSIAARARVADRRAWLLARRGDLGAARATLEEALAASESDPAADTLRARLGRLLVTTGRFRAALVTLAPVLERSGQPAGPRDGALALEGAILAHAYERELPRARALLPAFAASVGVTAGRQAYLAALVDQLDGDGRAAVDHYRRAYELSATQGDVHTLAAVALNLGALLADQGVYGEALAATERAVRELGRLGATSELGTALANAANLLVQLGDLAGARRALGRARDEAARRGVPVVEALAAFVDGDLGRREGRGAAAASPYRAAAAQFASVGQRHRSASALLAAADALASAGQLAEAATALDEGARLWREAGGDEDAEEVVQVRARLALARNAPGEESAALASRTAALSQAARAEQRRPSAWRLAVLAARLHDRAAAPDSARAALADARRIFEEVRMATPEHHRPGLESDPDARWLTGLGAAAGGDAALAARAAGTEARLRRLLRINKRLNSELRLPRLLEMIVDTVIELTDAERGFLLLEDDAGQLVVKVARNIDQRTLEAAEFELSRSIAHRAATGGEPIVTIDATGDERFKAALSVSDLHLRSVLAVPINIKGRAAGTVYVDHRLRQGAFGDDDVRLVLDFAEQAAIAIENARLLAELRRRERQVEALNRRLEVELAARREELSGMKLELRENREALAVRYDYRNIVGRTARMLDLFRLLDRLTDTALPVVIQGESGTGKELVARAIHFNGPRKARPFVSENCAAIPETLLESTLFGYSRGAFTGADHDARGLFEVADGGTLFLDEIGEMSPAMQGKLLRVLQQGEFRRVGSERTRKVDVRIVAATNRDLGRMVEEGKFRQDLYFRLNVARIALPALRERREDIPLIVERFLAKHAEADARPAPKPLEAAALARLVAYRWPGNVRELENEITRAHALSGERITAADLSPHVAAAGEGSPAAAEDPDSLLLKPRVERLERSLIREALGRSGNNQTRAADLLGLSRFGLQKKLKRYRFA
jgi:serine/threonine-protein kinase PknK